MTSIDRRAMLAASGAALILPAALSARTRPTQTGPAAFSWDGLVRQAQALSRTPFAETPAYPGTDKIDYDALNAARFRDDHTLWNSFADDVGIRFFPLNKAAPQPVSIFTVENGKATALRYDPAMFDMPAGNPVGTLGPDAGFAGFRVMNRARDADWLSFLGASYFRSAGSQRQYGLSARAIAINTSVGGEEFPRFTTFWLEKSGANRLTVHALLDGASITGAYRFVCRLEADGVHQDVTAALFPRRAIRELGLMPMTSMFWYDQANRRIADDWRPEVHDSDMLGIASVDGTAHTRPLVNPRAPRASVFVESDPKGFGLLQRDRDFDHYQDDGVYYDRRPSLWATPTGQMGAGEVRLYEFPTDSEYVDNVAAYWTPGQPVRAGRRLDVGYALHWTSQERPAQVARMINIWMGAGEQGGRKLVVDFSGIAAGTKPDIWTDLANGTLIKRAGYPVLGQDGLYRTVLDVKPTSALPVDIRLQLRSGDRPLSEMVHYPVNP